MVAVADAGTLLRDVVTAMRCDEGKASVSYAAWTASGTSVAAGRCAPPAGWGWIDRGSTNHRSLIKIIRNRQKSIMLKQIRKIKKKLTVKFQHGPLFQETKYD